MSDVISNDRLLMLLNTSPQFDNIKMKLRDGLVIKALDSFMRRVADSYANGDWTIGDAVITSSPAPKDIPLESEAVLLFKMMYLNLAETVPSKKI